MALDNEGPLSVESEQELMRQLVAGDEDAVRALYARFGRSVYTLGFRLLGSSQAAEELTQDVFVTAWRKAARFDANRGRLSTWLMAVAHNMAIDRLRHERGIGRPLLILVEQVPEPEAVEDESVLERDVARRAMASLSVAERDLLSRAYFYGWTAREISETDGIPLGTVKTRLRTSLIKLRASTARERDAVRAVAEGILE
jgi:RNA polymerase sigma-70 factor, ECF subfamily